VSRVLASDASPRTNHVFVLSFADEAQRARSFADPRYRRIREGLFEPAVASAEALATFPASRHPRAGEGRHTP